MSNLQRLESEDVASEDAIDYFSSQHPLRSIATKTAYGARKRMFNFFLDVMPVTPTSKIIDVGVTPDRDLADSNFFEQLYPYKSQITATSIEDASFLEDQYSGLRFVQTKGSDLPFEDKAFDIAFCSAVLEHVGNREQQRHFIQEITRVSKFFFLTTPNRQFPIEVHTFLPIIHWLPQPTHQAILRKLGMEFWSKTENLNLLTPTALTNLFPPGTDLKLHKHRLLGLPSNLVVYGNNINS